MIEELYRLFLLAGGRVSTDSRHIGAGDMFFALRGDNFDGNAYAERALQAGASVAVVDDVGVKDGFLVDNVLKTLQQLAGYHRRRLGLKIVALTGSNGKTTTKEFLRLALATKYNVGATVGNLNNHIGVPLTLLSFTESTEVGIVEMGASHCGEIAALCAIAQPDVGLITNIGRAHLEGFGSQMGVRRGKGELFDFLSHTARTAIYDSDDAVLSAMVSERTGLNAVGYRSDVEFAIPDLFGVYNVKNMAAAVAVAQFLGVNPSEATAAILRFKADNNRSQIIKTERGNTVIADCYNANPSSMQAAIAEFLKSNYPQKIMILGDMMELGEFSDAEHRSIVAISEKEKTYYVGENFMQAGGKNSFASTVNLAKSINGKIKNSTILLKGSRAIGLETLIDTL